ncbi:MAG: LysR family transcriptional regulator [Chloroflexi bacterium]|nr:LysR family transcriptional regulator [Chloroflexota bacterium]
MAHVPSLALGAVETVERVVRCFFRRAERVLQEVAEAQAELADFRTLKKGEIRLGGAGALGVLDWANLLVRFRAQYPGMRVRLIGTGTAQTPDEIRAGDIDVALLTWFGEGPRHERLAWEKVVEEERPRGGPHHPSLVGN